jgi:lipopolysaccharide/colanic/teichoic acid biosynthesis glycosyltransferase
VIRGGTQAILLATQQHAADQAMISPWCCSALKRTFDVICAAIALVPALPLMLVIALLVKLTSPGPVLFRQMRVGKGGREFALLKFRTMMHGRRVSGPGLTAAGDARVTRLGCVLRRCKLDELPQLINLLRGDMTLIGPRPDLAEFFAELTPSQRQILLLRPGITGWATLHYRHEEDLLAKVPSEQLKPFYMREVLPEKIRLDLVYANHASFWSDLSVILRTAVAILR